MTKRFLLSLAAVMALFAAISIASADRPAPPPPPPSDPAIVYVEQVSVKQAGLARDLWVMNADGTAQSKLLSAPRIRGKTTGYTSPSFSPDGSKIVVRYVAPDTACGTYDLRVLTIAVINNVPTVTNTLILADCNNPAGSVSYPVWSPDGSTIAYVAIGTKTIYFALPSGYNSATPIYTGTREILPVSWSPDGTKLIFATRESLHVYDIEVLNIATSTVTQVIPDGLYEIMGVDWSKTNSSLAAFTGYVPGQFSTTNGLRTFDVTVGQSSVELIESCVTAFDLTWDYDDVAIIYQASLSSSPPNDVIRKVNVATKVGTTLADADGLLSYPDRRRAQ